MQIVKRLGLFLITNLLIVALITIVVGIVSQVFQINLYGNNLVSIGIYALIFGFLWSFLSLATSRWMAKRAYGITPISKEEAYKLTGKELLVYETVRDLARSDGISMPEVGIYESDEANAFATGMTKNSSLVAVSSGLLQKMENDAIVGVVAHEMAHITNGDMVTMTLLQGVMNTFVIFISRIIMMGSWGDGENRMSGWWWIFAYLFLQVILWALASLVVMAFSRHREFRADEGSAQKVWKDKMIRALRSLQALYPTLSQANNPETASFAISAKDGLGMMKLFASHPPLEDRIRNLESQ